MRDEEQGKVAVEKGLPSLLRRTRSRQGRRRTSPSFCCLVAAGVLLPAGAAFSAPTPDPPPPGEFESPPTSLAPDRRQEPAVKAPPTAPAPVEQVTSAPVEQEIGPPMETPQPVAKRESTPRSHSVGRQFAPSKTPARRAPPAPAAHGNDAVALFSSDPNSRAFLLAALALAVLVLGSGTLLTVLARLRPERRRMA